MNLRDLVLLLVFSLGVCGAQSMSSKQLDAPLIGVVFQLDSANQTLKPLPDEPWTALAHGGIIIPKTGGVAISGSHSSFRIASGDKTEFVFKIGNPEHAALYRCTEGKNERQFSLMQFKGALGRNHETDPGVPVLITRFGNSSYRLVPQSPLSPGEYAVLLSGSKTFTFGVD